MLQIYKHKYSVKLDVSMRIWFASKTPTESLLGRNPEKILKSHSLPSAKKAVKKYCLKIKKIVLNEQRSGQR